MKTEKQSSNAIRVIKILVFLYDVITYPIYYLIQKPWAVLQKANRIRAKLSDPNDPYSAWVRIGDEPKHYLHECKTLPEAQQKLLLMNGRDKQCLGFRKILAEEEEKQPNGKLHKKWTLSDYQWLTIGEVDDRIADIARGLLVNDVKPKDTVLIFAETRIEWFLSAQAILRIGAQITTLYATLGEEGLIHGINETEIKHIITTEDLLPKLAKLRTQTPNIRKIIYVELKFRRSPKVEFGSNIDLVTFSQLESSGKSAPKDLTGISPTEDDIALIQYTSGSTGVPKGVILTHKNLLATFYAMLTIAHEQLLEADKHRYLSYLPLTHTLEFTVASFMYCSGVKMGYGTAFTLTNSGTALKKGAKGDINLLKPTFMAAVPMILDRIRKDIEAKAAKKGPFAKLLFDYIIRYKNYWELRGFRTPLIDYFICENIKSQIGGQIKYMFVGGAPLSPDTHKFLRACLNIRLCQAYGATETTAATTSMDLEDLTYGLIGAPLFGVKIKLIDWSEGGYRVTDKPNSRGEAVVGGNNIAIGYYKLDNLTKETFEVKDGIRWFKTGDIVEVNSFGSFKLIDRKKDFVKLQFGEYISLGKVESELIDCRFVDNICVYGNSFHAYMIAFIVPNVKALKELAQQLGIRSEKLEDLCKDEKILENVTKELFTYGTNVGLNRMEIPTKVKLCSEEWTPSNALVTPALKIRRKSIQQFYKSDIDRMYGKDK